MKDLKGASCTLPSRRRFLVRASQRVLILASVLLSSCTRQESSADEANNQPPSQAADTSFWVPTADGTEVHFSIPGKAFDLAETRQFTQRQIDLDRAGMYRSFVTYRNPYLSSLASVITRGAASKERKAQLLLDWVRSNIPFDDTASGAVSVPVRQPLQTIHEQCGTDRERSILFAALCRSQGIGVALLDYKDHMAVGVEGRFRGSAMQRRGRTFYFAETAPIVRGQSVENARIGRVPLVLKGSRARVYDLPEDKVLRLKNPSGTLQQVLVPATDYLRYREWRTERTAEMRLTRWELLANFLTPESPVIQRLALGITIDTRTPEEKASRLLKWCQKNTRYLHDDKSHRERDYFQFPLETLYEGIGDCEDHSLLYASLCMAAGLDVVLLDFETHVAVGVTGKFSGWSVDSQGKRYYVAETDPRLHRKIGQMGEGMREQRIRVVACPDAGRAGLEVPSGALVSQAAFR